jgi:hypothetical protein
MGFAKKAFVAAGVGFAAAALVGCGSSGRLLSGSEASTLRNELNHVSIALTDDQCESAEQWLADFQNKLASLGGVNSTLLDNLTQGASTTEQLTENECRTPVHVAKPPPPHTTSATTTTQTFTKTFPTQTTPTVSTETEPATTPTYSTPTDTYTAPDTTTAPAVTTYTEPPPASGGSGLPPASSTPGSGGTPYGGGTSYGDGSTSGDTSTDGSQDTVTTTSDTTSIATPTTDTTSAGPGL